MPNRTTRRSGALCVLALGLLLPGGAVSAGPADPGLWTVEEWESRFLGVWNAVHPTYVALSSNANSWDYYNLAYGVDGMVAMFEATGKTTYLDRGLTYVHNMIDDAVPSWSLPNSQFQDNYLAWGAWGNGANGGEYPLYESYCWRYVTNMLVAMRNNPAVYGSPTYRQQYDEILAFTKANIFNKWMSRGPNAYVYRSRTHMASHWALIALDLWLLTSDPVERARYKTVVDNINRHLPNYPSSLRRQMIANASNPAAYFWSDVWNSFAVPGQDVSHGNAVITYIVAARAAGVEWTDADIRSLSHTLLDEVWLSTPTGTRYAAYVDGSGAGNGWFSDGFIKLGRHDVTIQLRLQTHTVGRGVQLYGHGALNAKLLATDLIFADGFQ